MRVFSRVLAFLTPFRWRVLGSAGISALAVASNVGLLAIAGYLLAQTAAGQSLVLLTLPIYAVRLLAIIRAAARYFERLIDHDVTFRILAHIRVWVYDRLAALGPLSPTGLRTGDAVSRFVGDVEELQDIYLRSFSPITTALIIGALVAVVLQTVSAALAWIVTGYLALSGIAIPVLVVLLVHRLGAQEAERRGALASLLVDGIQGLQDLLLAGRDHDLVARVSRVDAELGALERQVGRVTALRVAGGDLLTNLAMWTSVAVLIPLVAQGSVPRASLPVVAFLVLAAFEATQPLGLALQSLEGVQASARRIFAVTDALPVVVSPPDPLPKPAAAELVFDGVGFRYAPDLPDTMCDISFAVTPGTCVAIVGPSGAGKSTLARLALRMMDPTSGHILLGGHRLSEYGLEDIRSLMTLVGQDTHVFGDTVRGNVRRGNPSAGDEELWQALEAAQLRETVERMPRGLDTWVGEAGGLLSGGERQRLIVARALIRRAPLLILDEPTANLDPVTEKELLDALFNAEPAGATLLITHRLVSMERMDEILVMDRARIVQRGSHGDLLAQEGLYRRMVAAQEDMLATV